MENEQIADDFVGANQIYLQGLLDDACALLPVLPDLPVPSLDVDDPAIGALLSLMRHRDEMAGAEGGLMHDADILTDAVDAARARVADADERISRARNALLAGSEPELRDAMLALVIDQMRADLLFAEDALASNDSELLNLRSQMRVAMDQIGRAVTELIAACRIERARRLEFALLNELRALAVSDGEGNRFNRVFIPAPELALLTSNHGQIEMLRPGRMPHLNKGVL